jgi:serine phosphatase RsbU (regulator of sigma subunit)/anti-sigma regulatory factor (Ser/Thr protein kinase)
MVDVNVPKDEIQPGEGQRELRPTARLARLPGADRAGRAGGARAPDRRLERLQSIADAALGYMSLEDMLGELLERIRGVLGVDTAAVLLLDEERNVLVARAARGLEEEVRQGVQVPLARGFAGRIASGGRPIVIEDLSRADVVNPILRQRGIRSMLGVPVHVEGRVIGVMHVGTLQRRAFGEDDVVLLQLAADRAALAIDNARLSEQRSVTSIMQRTLLPDALPQLPGLRFSAKYLPAGSGIKIGGDWYDVFQLDNGRVTFVIGDVVGRGVLAASVMAEIRTALRAYLMEGHDLSRVMALLNDLLVSMGRNRSATAAILELDLETGELEAVSAGHLPPLLLDPDGQTSYLEQPSGLPLGIAPGGQYTSMRHHFPVGSVLVLYTDGLVERRKEPIDEGLARLSVAAKGAARGEDASFADRVYRALVDSTSLEDDIAVLAIELLPLGRRMEMTLDARPGVLAGLRRTVARWLATQGLGEAAMFNLTLAASEAAANAIEHAYGAREASFTVTCDRAEREVRVTVKDTGRWRESQPYGRGRGLTVMRGLADSVDINRSQDGTTVTLTTSLPPTPR